MAASVTLTIGPDAANVDDAIWLCRADDGRGHGSCSTVWGSRRHSGSVGVRPFVTGSAGGEGGGDDGLFGHISGVRQFGGSFCTHEFSEVSNRELHGW